MRFFAFLLVFSVQPWSTQAQSAVTKQKFICNTGYTLQQCRREMTALRPILEKFHADALGEWSWILVRSEDWGPLMLRLRENPDSPALTSLEDKATFFDEALVAPLPARRAELFKIWQVPIDQLLDEAVTHEIGHSLCNDLDEARAEHRAHALRRGEQPTCDNKKNRS